MDRSSELSDSTIKQRSPSRSINSNGLSVHKPNKSVMKSIKKLTEFQTFNLTHSVKEIGGFTKKRTLISP